MTKKIKISDLKPFDIFEHLDNQTVITEYINIVLEENDHAILASLIGDISSLRIANQLTQSSPSHPSQPDPTAHNLPSTARQTLPVNSPPAQTSFSDIFP